MKMLMVSSSEGIPCGSKNVPGFSLIFSVSFEKVTRLPLRSSWFLSSLISLASIIRSNSPTFLVSLIRLSTLISRLGVFIISEPCLFALWSSKPLSKLGATLAKSDATRSRAGLSLSIDNSVMDRLGKLLRCTWSWYSGRCKKVVQGQDLLGIVLTLNQVALPVHLLFCSKQGRGNTDKPSQLITMLTQLK